jgi:hypothetical protein
MACEFCTEAIALDQPATEFLCNHKVHTECLLKQVVSIELANCRCPNCREFIVPREILEEAAAMNSQEGHDQAIRYMWEQEPEFKTGLQSLREARLAVNRAKAAVGKKIKELKAKQTEEIAHFMECIRVRVRQTKQQFKALTETKALSKANSAYNTKSWAFENRWGVGPYQIRHALRDVAAARTLVDVVRYFRRRQTANHPFDVRIQ